MRPACSHAITEGAPPRALYLPAEEARRGQCPSLLFFRVNLSRLYSLLPSSHACTLFFPPPLLLLLSFSLIFSFSSICSILSLSLSSCLLDSPHLPLSTSLLCFHWPQLYRRSKPSRPGPSGLDSEVNLLPFWFHLLLCSMWACVRCALHWPLLQLRLEVTPKLG